MVTKIKNSNCDKTQKNNFWQNSETRIVTTKNSNCDKTQKWKCDSSTSDSSDFTISDSSNN